jgi:DUF4097 and DUF4098 domain-containing protein YvlB
MRTAFRLILPGALLCLCCIYTYKLELPETRTWSTSGIFGISASTRNGQVTVTAAGDTLIKATITRWCYGRDSADAADAVKNVVVKDTVVGDEVRLWAEMPSGRRSYGAHYELNAPESTALSLSTSNGAITLTGMTAGADASTSNADITLLDTRGSAVLSTTNGKVQARVHRGSISIFTSNGTVDCDLAEFGATDVASLATSNGKVTLYLPADVSAVFDATTTNADITISGFAQVSYEISERTHKRGRIGSGASDVSIVTSNGDVVVRAR